MREVIATGKTVEEATEAGCLELGLSRDEVSVEIIEMPQKKLFRSTPAKVKVVDLNAVEEIPAAPVKAPEAPVAAAPKMAEKIEKNPEENKVQAVQPVQERPAPAPKKKFNPNEPEELIDLKENERAKQAVLYLESVFRGLEIESFSVKAYRQGDATLLKVEGEDLQSKIDTRGETIQALSYLTDRAVNTGVDKKDGDYLRIRLDVAGYRGRREGELISLAQRTAKEVQRSKRSHTLAPMNPYERLIVHTTVSEMDGVMSESIGADTERRVVIKSTAPDAVDGDDWNAHSARSGGSRRRSGGGQRPASGGGRSGGSSRQGDRRPSRPRGQGGPRGEQRSSVPEREYADKPRDPDAKPVVPERRDTIKDGEDLPLYGKIEL